MLRKMGDFEVTQRTKDGMFNATQLLKQWNEHSGSKKELASFFKMNSTEEYIEAIKKDNMAKSPYLKSRGKNGGTWMHPYLFIDFAMWLNPTFKVQVIKFVYDKMIKYRNEVGSTYLDFGKSVMKLVEREFLALYIKSY